jgi:hypothetical protein
MIGKSVIAGLAFMSLVAAGTMAGATPASAGYACGPWNGWCSWYGGHGWKNYGWGGYGGHRYWNKPYNNRYWGGGYGGYGKEAYKKGKKNKYQAYRKYNRRYY